jgi:hypothetical protein
MPVSLSLVFRQSLLYESIQYLYSYSIDLNKARLIANTYIRGCGNGRATIISYVWLCDISQMNMCTPVVSKTACTSTECWDELTVNAGKGGRLGAGGSKRKLRLGYLVLVYE